MDTKSPGFIRTGGNNSPALRRPANYYRLSLQFWVVELFDGGKKSIHIDMNDLSVAVHGAYNSCVAVVDGSLVMNFRKNIVIDMEKDKALTPGWTQSGFFLHGEP